MSPYVDYYACDGCGIRVDQQAHIIVDEGVTNVCYWNQTKKQYYFCDSCYGKLLGALTAIISKGATQQ